jgi:hypothetical protein
VSALWSVIASMFSPSIIGVNLINPSLRASASFLVAD